MFAPLRRICSLASAVSKTESLSNGREVSGDFVIGEFVKSRLMHKHVLRHQTGHDAQINGGILVAHALDRVRAVFLEIRAQRRDEMFAELAARTLGPSRIARLKLTCDRRMSAANLRRSIARPIRRRLDRRLLF